MTMTKNEEHVSAVRRLETVLAGQDRLSQQYVAAIGTATEQDAYARLQAAGDRVAARGAWLHWVDDERYRGLNAGPFELLADETVSRPAESSEQLSASAGTK